MIGKKLKEKYRGAGIVLLFMAFIGISFAADRETTQNPQLHSSVLNNSGGAVSSANSGLHYSLGQSTPIGVSYNKTYSLYAGFQPTTIRKFSRKTEQRGDVNGDSNIDILDVLAVVNHILGKVPLSGSAISMADCNGDGNIDVLDVIGIVNVILGIGTCGP